MTDVFNINYSSIFGGEKATRPNRKLRAAQKQESLTLPAHYQEIPEEEMYYEGGGFSIPRGVLAVGVDVLLSLSGINAIFLGVKMLGKKAKTKFLTSCATSLFSAASKGLTLIGLGLSVGINSFVGKLGSFLSGNAWIMTSPGNAIAGFFDWVDGYLGGTSMDGKITLW